MRVVPPRIWIHDCMTINNEVVVKYLAQIARTCYQTESRGYESDLKLVKSIMKNKHLSVLEHVSVTATIQCSRKMSHQLVRHRLASYTQESTRYNKYVECVFVKPHWMDIEEAVAYKDKVAFGNARPEVQHWINTMINCEKDYNTALALGFPPEDASDLLNHAVKTEIVMTANLREWLHILELRLAHNAHPDMRYLMKLIDTRLRLTIPSIFGDPLAETCL